MPEKLTLEQQIEKYIDDPELRYLLKHSDELAPFLESIENTYNVLNRELRSVKQILKYRTKAFETSQQLFTLKNQEINHRANHDSLTGLPNREHLLERIDASILQSQRSNTHFSLLFIDLDKFKLVNDHFGHDIGDLLLQKIAKRLRTIIRETDSVARLGGDEFCILLMNVESATDSARAARSLLNKFTKPLTINGQQLEIDMSIGISHYPEDGKTITTLLKNADIAMYEAKQRGPNNIQFYEKRLTEQVAQRIEFEKDLYEALIKKEFELQFQPMLQTGSGDLSGVIVTEFWLHPVRGRICSEQFYEIATDNSLFLPMLEWLFEQCCLQIQIWKKLQLPCVDISIAIEQGQFLHKALMASLLPIMSRYPEESKYIVFTVDEEIIAINQTLALTQFSQLAKLGIGIAISNCGSGLLPVNFLQKANINSLYIDSELIQEMDSSVSTARLVKGIVTMAKQVQIKTHAPGVTNSKQQRNLKNIGCHSISGRQLTEPMNETEFRSILARFKDTDTAIQIQDNLLLG